MDIRCLIGLHRWKPVYRFKLLDPGFAAWVGLPEGFGIWKGAYGYKCAHCHNSKGEG